MFEEETSSVLLPITEHYAHEEKFNLHSEGMIPIFTGSGRILKYECMQNLPIRHVLTPLNGK